MHRRGFRFYIKQHISNAVNPYACVKLSLINHAMLNIERRIKRRIVPHRAVVNILKHARFPEPIVVPVHGQK